MLIFSEGLYFLFYVLVLLFTLEVPFGRYLYSTSNFLRQHLSSLKKVLHTTLGFTVPFFHQLPCEKPINLIEEIFPSKVNGFQINIHLCCLRHLFFFIKAEPCLRNMKAVLSEPTLFYLFPDILQSKQLYPTQKLTSYSEKKKVDR